MLPKPHQTSTSPIIIEGFSHAIYHEGNLVSKIEADQFRISPRKFFIFRVKSVNEALIKKLRISLYLDPLKKRGPELLPFLEILPTKKDGIKLKGMGYVTRGVIQGLDIKIYQNKILSYHLSDGKAILDLKKKTLKINTARLKNFMTDEVFTSKTMLWHNEKNRLDIPGKYTLHSKSTQKTGQQINIPLYLPIHP